MFWEELLSNYENYFLVLARVSGIFIFNPIFARREVPNVVKVGASCCLAIIIGSTMDISAVEIANLLDFIIIMFKETFVGLVLGFLTNMFLGAMLVGGEVMDTQAGLGMAKIYDPSSGVQMPMFGSILNYMFIMYYFAINAHLSYIKLFALSYDAIPLGYQKINPDIGLILVNYFGVLLALAIKLAIPLIVAELLVEFCIGILMKAIPQIQVMVVNMQLKLLFGLVFLFITAVPMSNFLDKYMETLTESLIGILSSISG